MSAGVGQTTNLQTLPSPASCLLQINPVTWCVPSTMTKGPPRTTVYTAILVTCLLAGHTVLQADALAFVSDRRGGRGMAQGHCQPHQEPFPEDIGGQMHSLPNEACSRSRSGGRFSVIGEGKQESTPQTESGHSVNKNSD